MGGQEIPRRLFCRLSYVHVRPDPSGGQSDGVKHSAPTRAEDGDPGEQSHRRFGKEFREIRGEKNICLH